MRQIRFLVQKNTDLPDGASDWLTSRERDVEAAFRFDKPRSDWRLGRWTVKRALSTRLGLQADPVAWRRLEVLAAPDGAPDATLDGTTTGVALSLSHSHDIGLCTVIDEPGRIGCDIEKVEPREATFVETFFTPQEQHAWQSASPARRDRVATLIWSAKESALKVLREGLRLDTRSVDVRLGDGRPVRGWWRLSIRYIDADMDWRGWWMESRGFVLTSVSIPEAAAPCALQPSLFAEQRL